MHAIELNSADVNVTVKRLWEFTGKAATLESDGRTLIRLPNEQAILSRKPFDVISSQT